MGLCAPGTWGKADMLSSTATLPEELYSAECLSLSCFNSVAKNLKNTKFSRRI